MIYQIHWKEDAEDFQLNHVCIDLGIPERWGLLMRKNKKSRRYCYEDQRDDTTTYSLISGLNQTVGSFPKFMSLSLDADKIAISAHYFTKELLGVDGPSILNA